MKILKKDHIITTFWKYNWPFNFFDKKGRCCILLSLIKWLQFTANFYYIKKMESVIADYYYKSWLLQKLCDNLTSNIVFCFSLLNTASDVIVLIVSLFQYDVIFLTWESEVLWFPKIAALHFCIPWNCLAWLNGIIV